MISKERLEGYYTPVTEIEKKLKLRRSISLKGFTLVEGDVVRFEKPLGWEHQQIVRYEASGDYKNMAGEFLFTFSGGWYAGDTPILVHSGSHIFLYDLKNLAVIKKDKRTYTRKI